MPRRRAARRAAGRPDGDPVPRPPPADSGTTGIPDQTVFPAREGGAGAASRSRPEGARACAAARCARPAAGGSRVRPRRSRARPGKGPRARSKSVPPGAGFRGGGFRRPGNPDRPGRAAAAGRGLQDAAGRRRNPGMESSWAGGLRRLPQRPRMEPCRGRGTMDCHRTVRMPERRCIVRLLMW